MASAFRMRNLVLYALVGVAGAAASAQPTAGADAVAQARQFLLRYASLTDTSNVAALDLYRDDARIHVASYRRERETQAGSTGGADWKRLLRTGWANGTTRLEASRFQDATVERDSDRLVIHARRYSQTGCYWDNGYRVTIAPSATGQYQIVEERLSFQRGSSCPATDAVPPAAAAAPPAARAAGGARPAGLPSNAFVIGQGGLRPNPQASPAPAIQP